MLTPIPRTLTAILVSAAIATSACSSSDNGGESAGPAASPTAITTPEEASDTDPGAEQELENALEEIVADTSVPALGAAVFDHSGLIDQAVAGLRERDGQIPVDVDDVFHLGSNTKAMTAALLARLDQQGGPVGFDTTLGEAFGDIAVVHQDYASVTLSQLLSHTGGAPSDEDLDIDESILALPVTEARALGAQFVVANPPEVPPGTMAVYSNVGYVIVAAAVESATGQSWEDLTVAEVFEPLSMDSCGFGPPGTEGSTDQPLGHDEDSGEPIYWDNPAVLAPSGGIHCSMADWGRFLVELLNGYSGESDYLTRSSVNRLFEPADAPVPGFDGGSALGWLVVDGPQGTAWFHNGSNTAWFSQAAIVPDLDRVVIAVSNEASTGEQATSLAFAAVSELYPS